MFSATLKQNQTNHLRKPESKLGIVLGLSESDLDDFIENENAIVKLWKCYYEITVFPSRL